MESLAVNSGRVACCQRFEGFPHARHENVWLGRCHQGDAGTMSVLVSGTVR